MKFFLKIFFFILLTFQYIEAVPLNIYMPQEIKHQLCQKLSDHECTQEEQLQYNTYFKLNNDKLLLFFNTYKKDALYPNGSLNVPVIVDIKGKWQVIDAFISDEIQAVVNDPHDGIWLHTVSTRKKGYSSLYYSRDGKRWEKLKLPSIRTFQTLQLCFQNNEIILTFQRVENDNVKAWITTYEDALSDNPTWRLMEKKELYQKVCQKTSAYNNAWRLSSKKNSQKIQFTHKYKKHIISFSKKSNSHANGRKNIFATTMQTPRGIEPKIINRGTNLHPYTIQLGTFNYKTSLPLIYQEFIALKQLLVTKKIPKENRVQYKVFLGSFNSPQDARDRLQQLRDEYINSKVLKGAFITKLP
jgi:hypothetical protein